MDERITREDPIFSIQEPDDVERVAALLRELLESDAIAEAVARFSRLRSRDQADVIAHLAPEFQVRLRDQLTPENVGEIIEELEPAEAVELSQDMGPEQLSQVLDETSPDVAADVLRGLPEDLAARTLDRMEEAKDVAPLLEYED